MLLCRTLNIIDNLSSLTHAKFWKMTIVPLVVINLLIYFDKCPIRKWHRFHLDLVCFFSHFIAYLHPHLPSVKIPSTWEPFFIIFIFLDTFFYSFNRNKVVILRKYKQKCQLNQTSKKTSVILEPREGLDMISWT